MYKNDQKGSHEASAGRSRSKMTICQKVCFSSGIKSRTDSGLTSVTNMSHVGEILKDSLKNGKIRFYSALTDWDRSMGSRAT